MPRINLAACNKDVELVTLYSNSYFLFHSVSKHTWESIPIFIVHASSLLPTSTLPLKYSTVE